MNVVDWTIKIGDVTFDCTEVYALHFDLGMNMMLKFNLMASSIVPPWATGTYPSKYHLQLSAALTLRKQGVHRLVDRICDFLAKELIESPSGWRVYADHTEGDQVQLSVDCYTFDLNTLQFDAKSTRSGRSLASR